MGRLINFSREVADALATEILTANLLRIVDRNHELPRLSEALPSRPRKDRA
jgi:hypothetical protein